MQGGSGVDVDGDRDYRGVPVIGAWTWLPEYGFGVITKVDRAEAYRPLAILQTAFWSLFALLAAAAIALFVFTALVARLGGGRKRPRRSAKRLGPIHARRQDRRGRDGRRLPGPPRNAPPADRRQAAPPREDQRAVHRPVRARSAVDQPAHSSQHHHDLRLWPDLGGDLLLRDGVPRRRSTSRLSSTATARSPKDE